MRSQTTASARRLTANATLAAAAGTAAAVLVGRSPAEGLLALAVLAGVAALLVSVRWPTASVWLMLGLLFLGNRTEFPALRFWGRYAPTLALGLFLAAIVLRQIARGRLRLRAKAVVGLMALFLVVLFASTGYNDASARDLVLSVFANLRYPLFYAALLAESLSTRFYTRILTGFVILALLQIPVTLVQFSMGIESDLLAGTLGSNASLLAVMLAAQCALVAAWMAKRLSAGRAIAGVIGLFLPLLLGDVQAALLFGPILVVWVIMRHFDRRRIVSACRRAAPAATAVAVAIVIAPMVSVTVRRFYSHLPEHAENLRRWSSPGIISTSSVGRFTILLVSVPLLAQDPVRLMIGFGPEAASGGMIFGSGAGDATEVAETNIKAMGPACQALARRGVLCRESQSFKSVMEFGVLGTALYAAALMLVWRGAWRLKRLAGAGEARALALFFDGTALLYCGLAFWYIAVWRMDSYSLPFWLLAAAVDAERRRLRGEPGTAAGARPDGQAGPPAESAEAQALVTPLATSLDREAG